MSEHVGPTTHHTKLRGRIRRCEWCGQHIAIGERYGKWLFYDGGERSTVYAHAECLEAWNEAATEEGGVVYACGDNDRPATTP